MNQDQSSPTTTHLTEAAPIIKPGYTFASVTDKISSVVLTQRTPRGWYIGFGIGFLLTILLMVSILKLVVVGTGIWGITNPVAWGFAIINFVWWIGIGHAGTLISAILLLLRQEWRTSINRFAEAMTLFAVACAALYPLLHTGRPWLAIYWLFPISEYHGTLATVPESTDLGRFCRIHLCNRLLALLVRRINPGFGYASGSFPQPLWKNPLRDIGYGMARIGTPLDPL